MSTTHTHPKTIVVLAAIATVLVLVLGAGTAQAASPPIKEKLANRIGWEVIPHGTICTVATETCQPGVESKGEPGGFSYDSGVASDPITGDVYVTEYGNERVQELSASGKFVAMFGGDVNETTGADVCTQAEIEAAHVKCKAGTEGGAPGQFYIPESIAVDPSTGNFYVQDMFNWRVQEFTSNGKFVLMIGKDVNETTGKNLCTQEEIETTHAKCKAGESSAPESSEVGAFRFEFREDVLAVGGPENLLYVGDERRIQRFNREGVSKGDIPLTPIYPQAEGAVTALAVDKAGEIYMVYHVPGGSLNTINELEPGISGKEIGHIEVTPGEPGIEEGEMGIGGLALDPSSRLAVSGWERGSKAEVGAIRRPFGRIYDGASGKLVSEFAAGNGSGMTFGATDQLYEAVTASSETGNGDEILRYTPVDIGELVTLGVPVCGPGPEHESDETFACVLKGEANPENVTDTKVEFQWGELLGASTPTEELPTGGVTQPVEATIDLRPNETVLYRLAGNDTNVQSPELFNGATMSVGVSSLPPRILGQPSAQFVTDFSAVLFAELNPERATTRYEFQYGPCENLDNCPAKTTTLTLESNAYGQIGTTQEISGLQPNTTYHYRLLASNEQETAGHKEGGAVTGPQGTFTTGPAPSVQATTGAATAITTTGAVVSGTINPDGQPAAYSFELGVYTGTSTQYGIVYSASTNAETTPISESLDLSGLQPGTTYAYRITIHSGYGTAQGQPVTFTTEGLPTVLSPPSSLPQLAIPNIAFPGGPATKPVSKTKKTKAKAKKTKHKQKQKAKRKQARKPARKRHG